MEGIYDKLPTVEEELERKTFAELENLISNRELGKITNAEYLASLNTMFAICSGLVGKDFFELISAASGEAVKGDYSFARTRVFIDGDRIAIAMRTKIGADEFSVKNIVAKLSASKVHYGNGKLTNDTMNAFAERVIGKGMCELTGAQQ